ncbi:MAG: retropepsin-like domain-containing protein [Actinomycetota bacterium]|nr:retropepsin-like domain-containing protein [Actinomycetota bacterium]
MPENVQTIYVGSRRHVYVTVTWPTGQTADAVIDTGASVTVVDERFAAHHPTLFTHDSMSEGTDSSGTVMQTPMVQMAAVRMLGAEFRASVAAVVDLSAANATIERKMDLILGWPILSQGTFVIDHDLQLASYRPGAPSVS